MDKRVEGSYATVEAAMRAVERLRDEGYGRNDIYVVANSNVRDSIPFTMDAEVTTDADIRDREHEDHRSLWEKIKDAFTVSDYDTDRYADPDYDADNDPLYQYRDDIERGHVIVLVDNNATPAGGTTETNIMTDTTVPVDPTAMGNGLGTPGADTSASPLMGGDSIVDDNDYVAADRKTDPPLTGDRSDNDETIELREERLDVNKQEVQTGEVKIGKHVVEETESVDVPVTHEEVTIERRPVTDKRTSDRPISDTDETEEIVVPVKEEQVDVKKHTDVVEEVTVHKDKVTDHKTVSDTVRKEELDVDKEGHVEVQDTDEDMNHPK